MKRPCRKGELPRVGAVPGDRNGAARDTEETLATEAKESLEEAGWARRPAPGTARLGDRPPSREPPREAPRPPSFFQGFFGFGR